MALEGKLVLITGAGGGIGQATCKLFEQEGACLIAADINNDLLKKTMNALKDQSNKHLAKVIDSGVQADVDRLVEEILLKYDRPPSVVIHTVGVLKYFGGILNCTEEIWDKSIKVNLTATYLINRKFLDLMVQKSIRGSVVNFSSTASDGSARAPEYSAAKAAVEGLTKALAKEMAPHGIRVNAIKPGGIDTPLLHALGEDYRNEVVGGTPMGRPGTPEEVAQLCLFLGSDRSSFCTSSVYNITGGYQK